MDELDWAILGELQRDARLSHSQLAKRVHSTSPTVSSRVRKLEESGVIAGYSAHLDADRAGWPVMAFVRLACYGESCILNDPSAQERAEILEIHRVVGRECCIVKVRAMNTAHFEAVIDLLAGYSPPLSTMVLSSPLQWSGLTPPSGLPTFDSLTE